MEKKRSYFNNRKYSVRKVLIGFSAPIYEDAQLFCRVNNIRFTTLVNESLRAHLRLLRSREMVAFTEDQSNPIINP